MHVFYGKIRKIMPNFSVVLLLTWSIAVQDSKNNTIFSFIIQTFFLCVCGGGNYTLSMSVLE